ncbi:MAG: hypothetical protein WKH64_18160 [Chloroflexia bacterium]
MAKKDTSKQKRKTTSQPATTKAASSRRKVPTADLPRNDAGGGEAEYGADDYRDAARSLEEVGLDTVSSYAEMTFAPVDTGDSKDFPRATTDEQAASHGFAVLSEKINEAVAVLHALAAAADDGRDVPPELLVWVRPYLELYTARKGRE